MGAPIPTPGPWVVVDGARGPRQAAAWVCTVGNNPGDPAVFSTVRDGDKFVFGDKVADARLIAAAPEMLAALKALTEACGNVRPISGDVSMETVKDMRQAMNFVEAVEVARAAIAKAERA